MILCNPNQWILSLNLLIAKVSNNLSSHLCYLPSTPPGASLWLKGVRETRAIGTYED